MKYKITNKAITSGFKAVVSIGYCDAQYLLRGIYPQAYTAGTYGWNSDVYNIDGVAVVTGYRPTSGRKIDYKRLCEAENKARDLSEIAALELMKELVKEAVK